MSIKSFDKLAVKLTDSKRSKNIIMRFFIPPVEMVAVTNIKPCSSFLYFVTVLPIRGIPKLRTLFSFLLLVVAHQYLCVPWLYSARLNYVIQYYTLVRGSNSSLGQWLRLENWHRVNGTLTRHWREIIADGCIAPWEYY